MRQRGQESVEYALLVATVALLVLIGVPVFGGVVRAWFDALLQRIISS